MDSGQKFYRLRRTIQQQDAEIIAVTPYKDGVSYDARIFRSGKPYLIRGPKGSNDVMALKLLLEEVEKFHGRRIRTS